MIEKSKQHTLHSFIHYYPSCQLAYRAAAPPPLSLASLWIVLHQCFKFFISTSTVLHQHTLHHCIMVHPRRRLHKTWLLKLYLGHQPHHHRCRPSLLHSNIPMTVPLQELDCATTHTLSTLSLIHI